MRRNTASVQNGDGLEAGAAAATGNTARRRWSGTAPPCHRFSSAADAGELGSNGILPDVDSLRGPGAVPGEPADRWRHSAGTVGAETDAGDASLQTCGNRDGKADTRALEEGLSEAQAQECIGPALPTMKIKLRGTKRYRELARRIPGESGCGLPSAMAAIRPDTSSPVQQPPYRRC